MPQLALIQFLDSSDNIPSNELPGSGLNRPDNSLPGQGGAITLPVFPFDPTLPSNELPPHPPITVWPPRPGQHFIVKYLACKGLILVPSNELPETAEPK